MKTYFVTVPQCWTSTYSVKAETEEEAFEIVIKGEREEAFMHEYFGDIDNLTIKDVEIEELED